MKNLLTHKMLIVLLGVIILSTSCKKSEEESPKPTPVVINPNSYDTITYTYNLDILEADSTFTNTDTYIDNMVYTLDLSDFVSNDIILSDVLSIDVYDKGNFYAFDTSIVDKTIKLYANYLTYQNNSQVIKARLITDSTVNEVTVNFKLIDDVSFEVNKHLINNYRANTSQITSGAMLWKQPLVVDYNPTNKQSYGLSFAFYPNDYNSTTPVSIAGISTLENSFITLAMIKGKLQVVINDDNSAVNSKVKKYTITSFSNSTVYIKDNNDNPTSINLF